MKKVHRPGSMDAADAKTEKRFNAIFTAILLLLVAITVIPNNLYFHHYYSNAAGFLKFIGWVLVPVWIWLVWVKFPKLEWAGGLKGFVMFFGIAVILLFLFGFNLSLPQ